MRGVGQEAEGHHALHQPVHFRLGVAYVLRMCARGESASVGERERERARESVCVACVCVCARGRRARVYAGVRGHAHTFVRIDTYTNVEIYIRSYRYIYARIDIYTHV